MFFGQACTKNNKQFAESSSTDSGNGGGYEGKIPLIYHVNDESVSCGLQNIPKTILVYYAYLDEWFLIENSEANCETSVRTSVSGVTVDTTHNAVTYKAKTYTPPTGYLVDPLANADSSDLRTEDGVCRNAQGRCSLRAAIEQTAVSTFTRDLTVLIPEGFYSVSRPLEIVGSELFNSWTTHRNHKITISGEGKNKTIIDGMGLTQILLFHGILYDQIAVRGIGFTNGNTPAGYFGVGVVSYSNAHWYTYTHPIEYEPYFTLDDCRFFANKGSFAFALDSMYSNIKISNSIFEDNESSGLVFDTQMGTYLAEKNIFRRNKNYGLMITPSSAYIKIKDTLIYNNKGVGFSFQKCIGCEVENITVFGNESYGIQMIASGKHYGVASGYPNPVQDFIIKNSTIVGNGTVSGANIDISNYGPYRAALFYNSIIARGSSPATNCAWSWTTAGFVHDIVATNSIIDDSSCAATGTNNINVDPLLTPGYDILGELTALIPDLLSPAIDSGNNATCAKKDMLGNNRPTDFKGNGAICDMGAIEKQ